MSSLILLNMEELLDKTIYPAKSSFGGASYVNGEGKTWVALRRILRQKNFSPAGKF